MIAYTPCELDKIQVTATENLPSGASCWPVYYENFDSKRIQIIGLTEMSYLDELSTSLRNTHLEKLFSFQPPAIVLTRGMQPLSEMMQFAKQYGVPILMSTEMTSALMGQLITTLNTELAPRITRHGVLVEVYGEGILILGDSGVGKSETAIELVKRGHRLIADDAVELRRVSYRKILGTALRQHPPLFLSCAVSALSTWRGCSARLGPLERRGRDGRPARAQDRTRTMTARAWRRSITTSSVSRYPACSVPVMPGRNHEPSFWKRLPSTTARRRWATTPPGTALTQLGLADITNKRGFPFHADDRTCTRIPCAQRTHTILLRKWPQPLRRSATARWL